MTLFAWGMSLTLGCDANLGPDPNSTYGRADDSSESSVNPVTPTPAPAPVLGPAPSPAPAPAPQPKPTSCLRDATGVRCQISPGGATTEVLIPHYSDANGWLAPQYSSTLRYADMDGNGALDVCGRSVLGVQCFLWLSGTFVGPIQTGLLTDVNGWTQDRFYISIGLADVTGDGKADLCARAAIGLLCFHSDGTNFGSAVAGPAWADQLGYGSVNFNQSIRYRDNNADGKQDICARDLDGLNYCWLSDGQSFTRSGPL